MLKDNVIYDIIIIGAGVIGAFVARELSKYNVNVLVLEKNNDVCSGSSMANSAIIHSGYDPDPSSLKAKFNVLGNKMFDDIAQELDVPFKRLGSLTIATSLEEMEMLENLVKRAKINGVEAKLLSPKEVFKKEPNVSRNCLGALYAPSAGIIDPFALVIHAFENAIDNGVTLKLNERVTNIEVMEDQIYKVTTSNCILQAKLIINCAGVYGDEIASLIEDLPFSITARKGEYFVVDHFDPSFVNSILFPLPSKNGKGILITPTTSQNYLLGPTSKFIEEKDDLSTDQENLDLIRKEVNKIITSVPLKEVVRTFSGLRATSTKGDFIIAPSKRCPTFINVIGIESPGLTSAPAIGQYVVEELVRRHFKLVNKDNYVPNVRRYIRPKELSNKKREALVRINPKYGTIICNCEKVSLGEIEDNLHRSCPPRSFKALKKRVRSGFGKCQGGFCMPLIVGILAKHYNIKYEEVLYDGPGSEVIKESRREHVK